MLIVPANLKMYRVLYVCMYVCTVFHHIDYHSCFRLLHAKFVTASFEMCWKLLPCPAYMRTYKYDTQN